MSKKTLPQTFQNEARGGQHASQHASNYFQNGSKMAPWRPLGGPWARPCCQTLPGAVLERLWQGPKKSSWRPWNALGAKSGSISASWRVPGRVPEGVWEVIWGAFWRLGRRERKKKQKRHQKACFFEAVFACVFLPLPCVFCSPRRSPASKHNLKIC